MRRIVKISADHKPDEGAKEFPRVERLLALLGKGALLLAWPWGTKGTKKPWGHLTVAAMGSPEYLRALEAENIGVALGGKSNNLCSIDWDSDEWLERFLAVNPALVGSLRTRGARGGNVWVRIVGDYPGSYKIKTMARDGIGEWRADRFQTIISGQHPSGCAYSFTVEAKPVEISFTDIIWPEGIKLRRAEMELPIAHSSLSHTALSCSLKLPQVGLCEPLRFDVSPFVPAQRHQSDRLLFAMAGRLKTMEKQMQRAATATEKTAIFNDWWALAAPQVDPDLDCAVFLAKWFGDCRRRIRADDETALADAWKATQDNPLPAEAVADYGFPMSEKMRQLVGLCFQLQTICAPAPFFLGSRNAAPLLETSHRTIAYWLEILADKSGPLRILKKIRSGSQAAGLTNEYVYLHHQPRPAV